MGKKGFSLFSPQLYKQLFISISRWNELNDISFDVQTINEDKKLLLIFPCCLAVFNLREEQVFAVTFECKSVLLKLAWPFPFRVELALFIFESSQAGCF